MAYFLNNDFKNNEFELASRDKFFVDKTSLIEKINSLIGIKDRFVCITRPRRFGKSITLDAIETLFTQGLDPYFKGTYIAGNNEDGSPRWNESVLPVIRIDFCLNIDKSLGGVGAKTTSPFSLYESAICFIAIPSFFQT